MTKKFVFSGILALALALTMTVTGCDSGDSGNNGGDTSGGGTGTGTVVLKNSFSVDLRKIKLTNGGKQVGYDELLANNKQNTFSSVPTGLCTIEFQINGKSTSHNFTVSSGEVVNINYSSNGNFLITRTGGSGGTSSGGTSTNTDTGSIKIVNSSGYDTFGGTISGPDSKAIPAIVKGGNTTITGIAIGSYTVQVSSKRGLNLYYWKKTGVNVTKNGTTTVTLSTSGWGL